MALVEHPSQRRPSRAGPKGRHDPERPAIRHGHGGGSVTLGGRRVPIQRPRMRATDGSGEMAVPAYELFSQTEILGRMALDRMLGGVSTRRYPVALEPIGGHTRNAATRTPRSAESRRFVAQTEIALAELLAADLTGLDLVALMVDGVPFGEHTCVVALSIDIDGTKHPLSLVEGLDGERHLGYRADRGPARAGPGCHQAHPGGARRIEGAAPRGPRRVRPPSARSVSTSQDQERGRPSPGEDAIHRHLQDAPGVSRRLRAGRRARPHPPRRRGEPVRGHGRDPDRAAPEHAAHLGEDVPLNQRRR